MKKGSVKWNIPDQKIAKSPRTPRTGRSSTEKLADRSNTYSDTFEESSKDPTYSDTFVQDSYSDTFENGSTGTRNGVSPRSAKSKDVSQVSDNITTVVSATEFQDTTIKTAIDTEALETVIETAYDFSETQTVDSNVYSDTFESSDWTKPGSEHEKTLETKSYESSFTDTYSYRSRTPSLLSDIYDGSLDRSHVAPDYDGQSYMLTAASDDDEKTLSDDYSYTFEPTESSNQVQLVDPEELQREAKLAQVTEKAQEGFLQKMLKKLKDKDRVADTELNAFSPEPLEEDVSEDDHLRHFCKRKIKKLKRSRKRRPVDETGVDEDEEAPHPLAPPKPTHLADFGVPDSVLEKAKLINLISAMKKAASTEIHEPRKCPDCREEKLWLDTEDAERQFVLSRTKSLKSKLTDLQVEEHLLRMNSISMIAEIARGLPRHSEKPEKILDKLFEPLLGKNVMR